MRVTTVEQARALARRSRDELGVPDAIRREGAGLAVATAARRLAGAGGGRRVVVVCGTGGTGGVGLVAARALHADGARVAALIVGDPGRLGEASRQALEMATRAGVAAGVVRDAASEQVARALGGCDVVIDALLGTGLAGDVSGARLEAIEAINRAGAPVVSVDLPSGVDGDTGQVRGAAVRADVTVALGLPTLGAVLHPGAALAGKLYVAHLSIPRPLREAAELDVSISAPPPLPPRRPDGHKGTFGDVLFVAGAAGYLGAPGLAALSMLKAGGGYSRLAAPRSIVPHVAAWASEVVFLPQAETPAGSLSRAAAARLLELAEAADLVVLGPGLSLDPETQALVREIVPAISKPLLVDGDGLTAVAADPDVVRRRAGPTALTPHPGEMARLLGRSVDEIRADPVGAVRRAAADLRAAVVLKGARSLVGFPDGRVLVNPTGNSGMGTAGAGDVLDGAIAAMNGLGLGLDDAVAAGVFVHGLAGDLAAADLGEDGMTARDVLEHLPAAVRRYRAERDDLLRNVYGVAEPV
jgi:NAD(P)H-hydrate epimerase